MRHIGQCFNVKLAEIYKQATQLADLNQTVCEQLPENLRQYCHVGSFSRGLLVLNTTDSVWATQLRYLLPELRDHLRKVSGLYQLTSIKVHVSTHLPTPISAKDTPSHRLSENARASIQAGSDDCGYEPLKQALKNLAGET